MFYFSDFTITKREILFSFIILFISLCLGIIINNALDEHFVKKEEIVNKALKINNDNERFKYAIDTNIGTIINYGKFETIDEVKDDWLINSYMAYSKIVEKYTRHSKEVCEEDSNGNESCHTEYYYEWDDKDKSTIYSQKIRYSGIEFYTSYFSNYPWERLDISQSTIKENVGYLKRNYIYEKNRMFGDEEGDLRYYYEIIPNSFYATTLGQARNNYYEALNESKITINCETLEEYLSSQKSARATAKIIFWIFYIILVCIGIYYFIYIENEWLED